MRETRQIWNKMKETKLLGLFTRVSKGLTKTVMHGNGTGYKVSSDKIWTWKLRNIDDDSTFTVVADRPLGENAKS